MNLICVHSERVRARIRVRDGVRISNRVRWRVKLVNYSLITALSIATSADPLIRFLPVAETLHDGWGSKLLTTNGCQRVFKKWISSL